MDIAVRRLQERTSVPGEQPPASAIGAGAPARGAAQPPADEPDIGLGSATRFVAGRRSGLLPGDSSGRVRRRAPRAPTMPMPPAMPTFPASARGRLPGLGTAPGPCRLECAGWVAASRRCRRTTIRSGAARSSTTKGWSSRPGLERSRIAGRTGQRQRRRGQGPRRDASADKPESPPTGPTTVTLPDGETVTAASPQLAAAIKAAVGGAPIADAFRSRELLSRHRERRSPTPSTRSRSTREISASSPIVTRLPSAPVKPFSTGRFSTSPP